MNENTNVFARAAKGILRFATTGGQLSSEDLFDLSLQDLDSIGIALKKELEKGSGESLLEDPDIRRTRAQKENQLRFDVIKEVIDIRQTEEKARKSRAEKAARRKFLTDLRDKRELDELESLSKEDIDAQLAALDEEAA